MIIQSAPPFNNILSPEEAAERTLTLAKLVGCESTNEAKMVDCLRMIDPQVLINQEQSVTPYKMNIEQFPPFIDGDYLLDEPEVLLENNVFKKTNILIGTNANEGLNEMLEYLPELGLQKNLFELTAEQLDSAMLRMFHSISHPVLNLIKFQYGLYEEEDDSKQMKMKRFFGLQSALSDKEVVCVVNKVSKIFSNDGLKVKLFQNKLKL